MIILFLGAAAVTASVGRRFFGCVFFLQETDSGIKFVEVCPDPFPANFTGSGPGRDRGFRDRDGIGICPRVPRRDPSRDPSRDWPGLETFTYVTAVHM